MQSLEVHAHTAHEVKSSLSPSLAVLISLQGLHLEQRPLPHLQIPPQATSVYAFQLWAESHLKSPSSNHGILLSSCDILQLDKDEGLINRVLTLCFPYLIFMCSLTFLLQSHQAGTLLEQHADFLNKSWPFSNTAWKCELLHYVAESAMLSASKKGVFQIMYALKWDFCSFKWENLAGEFKKHLVPSLITIWSDLIIIQLSNLLLAAPQGNF